MDKRRESRHRKRLFVKFGKEAPLHVGFTEDLSMLGLFIKASMVFPPGTVICMELTANGKDPIQLRGRVMWAKKVPQNLLRSAKKSGMGIRLNRPPENYLGLVRELQPALRGAGF